MLETIAGVFVSAFQTPSYERLFPGNAGVTPSWVYIRLSSESVSRIEYTSFSQNILASPLEFKITGFELYADAFSSVYVARGLLVPL